LKFRLTKSF